MWHETDLAGVFISPLVVYMAVALVIWLPVRWLFERLRLDRWVYNAPLAEASLYVGILALLVVTL